MPIRVIGAGFGRTGTLSLKSALEILGFAPCYHMETVFSHPWHARSWLHAYAHAPMDWEDLLGRYQAIVDWPGCTFYRELMDIYPQARVILTVREPQQWYTSTSKTIYSVMNRFPLNRSGGWIPLLNSLIVMLNRLIWDGTFHGRFTDQQHALRVFEDHIAEVQRQVPPENLLVYQINQGWEPLCRFLGVPEPEGIPFPHLNDRQAYLRKVRLLTLGLLGGMSGAAFLAGAGLGWWRSRPGH